KLYHAGLGHPAHLIRTALLGGRSQAIDLNGIHRPPAAVYRPSSTSHPTNGRCGPRRRIDRVIAPDRAVRSGTGAAGVGRGQRFPATAGPPRRGGRRPGPADRRGSRLSPTRPAVTPWPATIRRRRPVPAVDASTVRP